MLSTDKLLHHIRNETLMTTDFFKLIHTKNSMQFELFTAMWIVDNAVEYLSKTI